MSAHLISMPDIGEGIAEAEVAQWYVAVGDTIAEDDALCAVLTDKATVDIPSPIAGTVTELHAAPGALVAVGSPLVTLGGEGDAAPTAGASPAAAPEQPTAPAPPAPAPEPQAAATPSHDGDEFVIAMPDVGEGIAEAEISSWLVTVGDTVDVDDALCEVLTDKAVVEIPSTTAGVVISLGAQVGETLAVGAEMIRLAVPAGQGNAAAARPAPVAAASPQPAPTPTPAAATPPAAAATPAQTPAVAAQSPSRPAPVHHRPVSQVPPRAPGEKPLAAPSVRKRAREAGVDLRLLRGTGPAGRITAADLDSYLAHGAPVAAAGPVQRTDVEDIPVRGMRRTIAQRMQAATRHIPHITIVEELDVTALEDLRGQLNASRGDRPKLTLLPFIIKAIVTAVDDQPELNAHYDDEAEVIHRFGAVHLGIATQTDAGLMVPVVRHCEALGLFAAAEELNRVTEAARTGTATREELSGSTLTITSLGKLGALATTPIINRPEVAIVGINKIATRPLWDGSSFQPRQVMNISCSFDHRVIDGWDAAVFVARLKTLLESPALIFVEN